jgi:hypothetical protein
MTVRNSAWLAPGTISKSFSTRPVIISKEVNLCEESLLELPCGIVSAPEGNIQSPGRRGRQGVKAKPQKNHLPDFHLTRQLRTAFLPGSCDLHV